MTDRRLRSTAPVGRRTLRLLDALAGRAVNFDPSRREELLRTERWHVDDRCRRLPPEAPGPPEPDRAWAVACRLLDRYAMADPAIVRAVYDEAVPLDRRELVLEGRFLGLRFPLGVRVTAVVDVTRRVDGRTVTIHGWGYRTLEGHLERGQMDWEVWKWHDTGAVEFRIHAFSAPARITNPVVRLGFVLFGRAVQRRFYTRTLDRMDRLVAGALDVEPAGPGGCVPVEAVAGVTLGAG